MTINQILKLVGFSVLGIFALCLLLGMSTTVPQGSVGVYLSMGKADTQYLAPGFHLKAPFVSEIKLMPVTTFRYDSGDMNLKSKDKQHVTTKITVIAHIDPAFAVRLYGRVAGDPDRISTMLVNPVIPGVAGTAFAHYTIDELVTKRDDLRAEMVADVKKSFAADGLILDDLNVTSFNFSDSYNKTIEDRMAAEQSKTTAQLQLDRQTIQARLTVVTANAEADAAISKAKGDAEAVRLNAEAEAKAIRIKNEALAGASPMFVQYEAATRWNGVLPQYTNGTPFLNIPVPSRQ